MSLSEARFHDLVDATQQALEDLFDESGLDLDMENSGGVLTIKFENGSQLIFSRQEPLRQLWLADRSGGFHFDYDEESGQWTCEKSDEPLGEMLERLVRERAGTRAADGPVHAGPRPDPGVRFGRAGARRQRCGTGPAAEPIARGGASAHA